MTDDRVERSATVYCTIVARNYLPQALTLVESVSATEPEVDFVLLVIDGSDEDVPLSISRTRLRVCGLEVLDLPPEEIDNLATIYDVVELSTGVKPRLLRNLLHDYQRAIYLDPDMYVVTPLVDLPALVDEFKVVLTPHILNPIPAGTSFASEGMHLTVGIHNLGFCAVGRGAEGFLDWWWSHLQRECLIYPLLGLFVDQKWVDMGAVLFNAHSLMHSGYNIGHWNLHERRFTPTSDGVIRMDATKEPLRLMHFSGFDPHNPQGISVRQNESLEGKGLEFPALIEANDQYAANLLRNRRLLGPVPTYGFSSDSNGRPLSKRLRRTYRSELIRSNSALPSAFDPTRASDFAAWRRSSWKKQLENASMDASLAFKYAFPDTFYALKKKLPGAFSRTRSHLLSRAAVRR